MIVAFLVERIKIGKLTYKQVVTSRPDLKEDIDTYITSMGLDSVIDKTV